MGKLMDLAFFALAMAFLSTCGMDDARADPSDTISVYEPYRNLWMAHELCHSGKHQEAQRAYSVALELSKGTRLELDCGYWLEICKAHSDQERWGDLIRGTLDRLISTSGKLSETDKKNMEEAIMPVLTLPVPIPKEKGLVYKALSGLIGLMGRPNIAPIASCIAAIVLESAGDLDSAYGLLKAGSSSSRDPAALECEKLRGILWRRIWRAIPVTHRWEPISFIVKGDSGEDIWVSLSESCTWRYDRIKGTWSFYFEPSTLYPEPEDYDIPAESLTVRRGYMNRLYLYDPRVDAWVPFYPKTGPGDRTFRKTEFNAISVYKKIAWLQSGSALVRFDAAKSRVDLHPIPEGISGTLAGILGEERWIALAHMYDPEGEYVALFDWRNNVWSTYGIPSRFRETGLAWSQRSWESDGEHIWILIGNSVLRLDPESGKWTVWDCGSDIPLANLWWFLEVIPPWLTLVGERKGARNLAILNMDRMEWTCVEISTLDKIASTASDFKPEDKLLCFGSSSYIYLFDLDTKAFKRYSFPEICPTITIGGFARHTTKGTGKDIWIVGKSQIYRLELETFRITTYPKPEAEGRVVPSGYEVWLGLNKLDPESGQWIPQDISFPSELGRYPIVFAVQKDYIWTIPSPIWTSYGERPEDRVKFNGIAVYDRKAGRWAHVTEGGPLLSDTVGEMVQDGEDIWMITGFPWENIGGKGIQLFKSSSNEWITFTKEEGLPGNSVINLVPTQRYVWARCSDSSRVGCFDKATGKWKEVLGDLSPSLIAAQDTKLWGYSESRLIEYDVEEGKMKILDKYWDIPDRVSYDSYMAAIGHYLILCLDSSIVIHEISEDILEPEIATRILVEEKPKEVMPVPDLGGTSEANPDFSIRLKDPATSKGSRRITSIFTDESWRVLPNPGDGWMKEELDDSSWDKAYILKEAEGDNPPAVWTRSNVEAVSFRRWFDLDADLEFSYLMVSFPGRFSLYVNGLFAGSVNVAGDDHWFLFDLMPYLRKPGKNFIAIMAKGGKDSMGLRARLEMASRASKLLDDIPNPSFETGDLSGWTRLGNSFSVVAIREGAWIDGRFAVLSLHSSHPSEMRRGSVGVLISDPFLITKRYLSFLVWGPTHSAAGRISLYVDGVPVATSPGDENKFPRRVVWDISAYKGKVGTIVAVDSDGRPAEFLKIGFDNLKQSDDVEKVVLPDPDGVRKTVWFPSDRFYSISGDVLRIRNMSGAVLYMNNSERFEDGVSLEMDFRALEEKGRLIVIVGYDGSAMDSGYWFDLHLDGSQSISVRKQWRNLYSPEYVLKQVPADFTKWNHLRVVRFGASFELFINGKLAISFEDPAPLFGPGHDHIAIAAQGTDVEIKDVRLNEVNFLSEESWPDRWRIRSIGHPDPVMWYSNMPQDGLPSYPNPGRSGILSIHPVSMTEPAELLREVILPKDKRCKLVLGVSGGPNDIGQKGKPDWLLRVVVNDLIIDERIIDAGQNADAANWKDLAYDLSAFSGRKAVIKVQACSGGTDSLWWCERAYFDYVGIEGIDDMFCGVPWRIASGAPISPKISESSIPVPAPVPEEVKETKPSPEPQKPKVVVAHPMEAISEIKIISPEEKKGLKAPVVIEWNPVKGAELYDVLVLSPSGRILAHLGTPNHRITIRSEILRKERRFRLAITAKDGSGMAIGFLQFDRSPEFELEE